MIHANDLDSEPIEPVQQTQNNNNKIFGTPINALTAGVSPTLSDPSTADITDSHSPNLHKNASSDSIDLSLHELVLSEAESDCNLDSDNPPLKIYRSLEDGSVSAYSGNKKPDKDFRYKPSSAVFVASLTSSKTDDHLVCSVTNHFKCYGDIFVKVLRNKDNHPYSFVHFENDECAKNALTNAPHTKIDGRPIRCEPANANRTIFFANPQGHEISSDSIIKKTEPFGEIEQLIPIDDRLSNSKMFPENNCYKLGWFCRFMYREDAIAAYTKLRPDASLVVQWVENVRLPCEDILYIDKKTVFIGHLDPNVSSDQLREKFEKHGEIIKIDLVNKIPVFAFVYYRDEKSASAAIEKEHHTVLGKTPIIVSYREFNHDKKRKSKLKLSASRPKCATAAPPLSIPEIYNIDSVIKEINSKLDSRSVTKNSLFGQRRSKMGTNFDSYKSDQTFHSTVSNSKSRKTRFGGYSQRQFAPREQKEAKFNQHASMFNYNLDLIKDVQPFFPDFNRFYTDDPPSSTSTQTGQSQSINDSTIPTSVSEANSNAKSGQKHVKSYRSEYTSKAELAMPTSVPMSSSMPVPMPVPMPMPMQMPMQMPIPTNMMNMNNFTFAQVGPQQPTMNVSSNLDNSQYFPFYQYFNAPFTGILPQTPLPPATGFQSANNQVPMNLNENIIVSPILQGGFYQFQPRENDKDC